MHAGMQTQEELFDALQLNNLQLACRMGEFTCNSSFQTANLILQLMEGDLQHNMSFGFPFSFAM